MVLVKNQFSLTLDKTRLPSASDWITCQFLVQSEGASY